jgi:hypothetical protein
LKSSFFWARPTFSTVGYTGGYMGHHLAYDEKATLEAQRRADAFMDAHMPPK